MIQTTPDPIPSSVEGVIDAASSPTTRASGNSRANASVSRASLSRSTIVTGSPGVFSAT